jgi:hypothetical protein
MSKTASNKPVHRVLIWAFTRRDWTDVSLGLSRPRLVGNQGIVSRYDLIPNRAAKGMFGSLPLNKLVRLSITTRVLKDKEAK